MREVDVLHVVGRRVILLVKTEARHRLGDDTALRELEVVGSREEVLLRVRVGHQPRAAARELSASLARNSMWLRTDASVIAGPAAAGPSRPTRPAQPAEVREEREEQGRA